MKSLLECIFATTFACLAMSSLLHRGVAEENDVSYNPEGHPSRAQGYMNLLHYLQQQRLRADTSNAPNQISHKRFTDFAVPYMKYKVDKRNDGIWIWMPAQGYVSVPHQNEDQENALVKQGKIMRYGK